MKTNNHSFKLFSLSLIWLWLGIFALIPIVLTLVTSFLSADPATIVKFKLTLTNFTELFNHAYFTILLHSFDLALACTLLCLIIAFPFAFTIASSKSKYRHLLLLLVIIPFWTSSLIRTYAILAILKTKGIVNSILLALGIIHAPIQILYSYFAVLTGSVYDLLPFMILPLYAIMEKLNPEYLEAARDLGANKTTTFIKIIIPLAMPGIISGSVLVFLPAMTMFFIPVLLGGAKNLLLGNLIEHQFLIANNWPVGAAISVFLTLFMGMFILVYWRSSQTKDRVHIA